MVLCLLTNLKLGIVSKSLAIELVSWSYNRITLFILNAYFFSSFFTCFLILPLNQLGTGTGSTRTKSSGGKPQVSAAATRAERRVRAIPGASHTFGKATTREVGDGVDGVFGTTSFLQQGHSSGITPSFKL